MTPLHEPRRWVRYLHRGIYVILGAVSFPVLSWAVHIDRAVSSIPDLHTDVDGLQSTCVRRDDVAEIRSVQVEAAALRGELEGLRTSVSELRALVQALLLDRVGQAKEAPDGP
jgi:hypothetical protein